MGAMTKTRIDKLLVDRGLVDNAALAQRLLMAGQVRVNGQLILSPATRVDPAANLTVENGPRFVSRGGDKLEAGLQAFGLDCCRPCLCGCGRIYGRFYRLFITLWGCLRVCY